MSFEYVSAKEAVIKIGVTEHWMQQLCKDGKVEGAKQFGTQGLRLVPVQRVQYKAEN